MGMWQRSNFYTELKWLLDFEHKRSSFSAPNLLYILLTWSGGLAAAAHGSEESSSGGGGRS